MSPIAPVRSGVVIDVMMPPYVIALTSTPFLLVSVNCSIARPSTVPKGIRFTTGPGGVVFAGASTVRGPLHAALMTIERITTVWHPALAGLFRLAGVIGAVG